MGKSIGIQTGFVVIFSGIATYLERSWRFERVLGSWYCGTYGMDKVSYCHGNWDWDPCLTLCLLGNCPPPFRRKAEGLSFCLSVFPSFPLSVLPFAIHPSFCPPCRSRYLVGATPPTDLYRFFWNFTDVLDMVWRYACGLNIILRLFFVPFFASWT